MSVAARYPRRTGADLASSEFGHNRLGQPRSAYSRSRSSQLALSAPRTRGPCSLPRRLAGEISLSRPSFDVTLTEPHLSAIRLG
jgi:hypothetical protein